MRPTEPLSSTESRVQKIAGLLRDAHRWVVLAHVNPDGDTLGTGSAFVSTGRRLGKTVLWGGPSAVPEGYRFLAGTKDYVPDLLLVALSPRKGDVVLSLDTSTRDRSVRDLAVLAEGVPLVNVDHHEDNERYGSVNWIDPSASATGEMGFLLLHALQEKLSLEAAEGLYVAIATDSGNFTFSSTTPRTHEIAGALIASGVSPERMEALIRNNRSLGGLHLRGHALGRAVRVGSSSAMTWLERRDFDETKGDPSETENLVNELMTLKGVLFAVLLMEEEKDIRASLRSRGPLSAAAIARSFGGGGHPQAAGCRLPLPLEAARKTMASLLEDADALRPVARQ